MNNNFKIKILVILLTLLFFGNLFVPNFVLGDERESILTWTPGVKITGYELIGALNPSYNGYYANQTYQIVVFIENIGEMKLNDLNISLEIEYNSVIYEQNFTLELTSLSIGEEDTVQFTWDNLFDDTIYNIFLKVSAMAFSKEINDTFVSQVHIQTVSNSIRFISFSLWNETEVKPAYDKHSNLPIYPLYWHEWYGVSHMNYTPEFTIRNSGNQPITGPLTIQASCYDYFFSGNAFWQDSKEILNSGILYPGFEINVLFESSTPLGGSNLSLGTKMLNVTGLYMNTSFLFNITDIRNIGVMQISNYQEENTYNPYIDYIDVKLMNNGNLNLTDWWIDLYLTIEDHSGKSLYSNYTWIDGWYIHEPGSSSRYSFYVWDLLDPGKYYFNVSISPSDEINNSQFFDNFYSISLYLDNITSSDIEIISPISGQYHVNDINDLEIVANVVNIGTLDLFPTAYHLNASYENLDTGEKWINKTNIFVMGGIPQDESLETSLGFWFPWINYNADFKLTVTLSETLGVIIDSTFIYITLAGGDLNGTVTGKISLGNFSKPRIIVTAYTGTTLIKSVSTASSGDYQMSLLGSPGGINYTIAVLASDNYWYYDAEIKDIVVMSGRASVDVDIALTEKPTGNLNGTVNLMPMKGGPELEGTQDVTESMVIVNDTPIQVYPNATGWFDVIVVAVTINVSAHMTNFKSDFNDNIIIMANENVTVNLTLYEDWSVMVIPGHKDIHVPTDTAIMVNFNEEVNQSSVNSSTFMVTDKLDNVIGDVDNSSQLVWIPDSKCFEFNPVGGLEGGIEYKIVLTTNIQNKSGSPILHREWESIFTTELIFGIIQGYVIDANIGVPIDGVTIKVGDAETETNVNGQFSLELTPGIYSITGKKDLYIPDELTDIEVLAGESTLNVNLTLKPIINIDISVFVNSKEILMNPESEPIYGVDLDTEILMKFKEYIEIETLNLKLMDSSKSVVEGETKYNATTQSATFTPISALIKDEDYTLIIFDSVKNETNNTILPRNVSWYFYTYIPDYIVKVTFNPSDGAVDQELDVEVKITFSHAMDKLTTEAAITSTFTITNFNWSEDDKSVVLEHDNFEYNKSYVVSISNAGKSIDGNKTEIASIKFTTIKKDGGKLFSIIIPVMDENKKPINGAKGELQIGNKKYISYSENGVLTFQIPQEDWVAGNWTVTISNEGYKDLQFDIELTDTPGIYKLPEEIPRMEKEEIDDKTKGDEDQSNMLLIVGIIAMVIIIIVLLLIFLLITKSRKRKEEELEEEEIIREPDRGIECSECGRMLNTDWKVCPGCGTEVPIEEPVEEEEEWEMADEGEGEVGDVVELVKEEEEWEMVDEEYEMGAKPEKPMKGKILKEEDIFKDLELEDDYEKPPKGKIPQKPTKGKLPVKEEFEELEEFEGEELEEVEPDEEHVMDIYVLEGKAEKCGICLGTIKPGLLTIKCRCGKFYHDSCGHRVGECPSCEVKFDQALIKQAMDEKKEGEFDFSTLEEFQQPYPKKPSKSVEVEPEKGKPTPMDILKERLAKGEIDLETFEKLSKKLE